MSSLIVGLLWTCSFEQCPFSRQVRIPQDAGSDLSHFSGLADLGKVYHSQNKKSTPKILRWIGWGSDYSDDTALVEKFFACLATKRAGFVFPRSSDSAKGST